MTIEQSLLTLSQYPVPTEYIAAIAMDLDLSVKDELTYEIATSNDYKIAKARVYQFLSCAPNITESGFSVSLDANAKDLFRRLGQALLSEVGVADSSVSYGYQGEDF